LYAWFKYIANCLLSCATADINFQHPRDGKDSLSYKQLCAAYLLGCLIEYLFTFFLLFFFFGFLGDKNHLLGHKSQGFLFFNFVMIKK
jgi:hypothetical protein